MEDLSLEQTLEQLDELFRCDPQAGQPLTPEEIEAWWADSVLRVERGQQLSWLDASGNWRT